MATPTKNCFGCWSLVLLFRLNDNRVVSSVTVLVMMSETTLVKVTAAKTHPWRLYNGVMIERGMQEKNGAVRLITPENEVAMAGT